MKIVGSLVVFVLEGPVARSVVSANRWLRGIKTYRFPWYLTLVSFNHASSHKGQGFTHDGIFMPLNAQVEMTAGVANTLRITRIILKFIHNALLVYK